jgi:hypothetical protein
LVSDPDAMAQSLKDADLIAGRNFKLPQVKLDPGSRTGAPIVVQGSVKAFIIGSQTLSELCRHEDDDHWTVYVVNSTGITELVHDGDKWGPVGNY